MSLLGITCIGVPPTICHVTSAPPPVTWYCQGLLDGSDDMTTMTPEVEASDDGEKVTVYGEQLMAATELGTPDTANVPGTLEVMLEMVSVPLPELHSLKVELELSPIGVEE